ncbi:MAG TPA: DUF6263 family protein [Verrucomicrobiae bacterium]|nr:DUF6263 family protein [Verrucomicrobiae bacterium]
MVLPGDRSSGARIPVLASKLLWLALLLTLSLTPARAQDADEQFVQIYNVILKADSLSDHGQKANALDNYKAAQGSLLKLQRKNPTWNSEVVSFRLNYLAQQIAALSATPASADQPGSQDGSTPAPGAAAMPGTVQIKVLQPGAEPRSVLRLHVQPGDKQSVTMTLKMGMEMKMGEMQTPMKLPAMNMNMDVAVESVSADGEITYRVTLGDTTIAEEPGAPPQMADVLKTALGGTKGTSGSFKVTSRGVSQGNDMSLPAGANPQLGQAIEQMKQSLTTMAVPLPEEPLGPGARWEARTQTKSQGITVDQTATYELVSAEGDVLKIKSNATQHAANQKIESPSMPGVKVDLTKMNGSASGETMLNLTHVVPQKATMDSHLDMAMGMNLGAQKQNMGMKMDIGLLLEAK